MRVINLTFDASITGVATLINTQTSGNVSPVSNQLTNVKLNVHNVGAWTTIQTVFPGTPPTYTVECNLGIIDNNLGSATNVEMIVDPNGWVALPASILAAGQTTAVIVPFSAVFLALRINVAVAGSGTGTFKVLQQGIM